MESYSYILTIAIPTYNRSKILEESLLSIIPQLKKHSDSIEFLISDNCSSDNTEEVVSKFINSNFKINYIKNKENIGMDRNFVQCLQKAKGKYIWILGDDDHLLDDSLDFVIDVLKKGSYGLVHIDSRNKLCNKVTKYDSSAIFLSKISYWITFLSGNIVRSKYVKNIDFEFYYPTYLALMPLWMTAAIEEKENILINKQLFEMGKDMDSNGGYNFYEVFVENYLKLWKEFSLKAKISQNYFEVEKKQICKNFILPFSERLLFSGYKGKLKRNNAYRYLYRNYWKYPYFHIGIVRSFIVAKIKLMIRFLNLDNVGKFRENNAK